MRYIHTNIIAKDWKRLADFYIKVFDCKIKPPKRIYSGSWLDSGTGLKNAQLNGVHLYLPGYENDGPTLEIFSYREIEESETKKANHTGFTHIAFEVEDVDVVLNNAINSGGKILGEITEKEIENIGKLKFVYFYDPENNIIEIQSLEKFTKDKN